MRIISGKYRGRKLFSPSTDEVRPTTDRIKETVFNVLQFNVNGAKCLDLFSGSGALGIECISRGAKEVVFSDKNGDSLALTKKNLKGIEGDYRIMAGDFVSVLNSLSCNHEKFDLIFIDPPYGTMLGEIAIDIVAKKGLLNYDGIVYFEHESKKDFTPPTGMKTRTKKMGYTTGEFVSNKTVAMVTGSFDPITKGHEAVIDRATALFDEVVVACLVNPLKQYYFTPEERLALVQATIGNKKGVRAVFSRSSAVECAKNENASVFVRGLRSEKDLPYEEEMKAYNLQYGIDTVFVETGEFCDVSSTRAKEEIKNGHFRLVPNDAIMKLKEILENK